MSEQNEALDAITQESTPPADTAGTAGDDVQQEGYNDPGASGPPTTPEVLPAAALTNAGMAQGSSAVNPGVSGGETAVPGGTSSDDPGPADDPYAGKTRDDLKGIADERGLTVEGTGSNGYVTADDYKNALVADDQAKAQAGGGGQ